MRKATMYTIDQIEKVGADIHNQVGESALKSSQMVAISNVYLSMLDSKTTVITKEALSPQVIELIDGFLDE